MNKGEKHYPTLLDDIVETKAGESPRVFVFAGSVGDDDWNSLCKTVC